MHIKNGVQGQMFLAAYSVRTDLRLHPKFFLRFTIDKHQDGGAKLRDERFKEERMQVDVNDLGQKMNGEIIVPTHAGTCH